MLHKILSDWLNNHHAANIAETQQNALNNPRLYQFLSDLYDPLWSGKIMQHQETQFPVAIFPASKEQRLRPESVIRKLEKISLPELGPPFDAAGELYLKKLKRLQPGLWDGVTYTMLNLETGPELKLTCGLGTYFNTLKSCDILEFELLSCFVEEQPATSNSGLFGSELLLREQLHHNCNPLRKGCGRHASVGISTLIIYAKGDSFYGILRYCTPKLAFRPKLYHVIPSMMMEAVAGNFEKEFSVIHNIYREYLEEVFEKDEIEYPAPGASYNFFYDVPEIQELERMLTAGDARLYLTGVAIDLLKLRPEICTLLFINDRDWIRKYEHAGRRRATVIMDLNKTLTLSSEFFRPEAFSPPGAAALKLGIEPRGKKSAHRGPVFWQIRITLTLFK